MEHPKTHMTNLILIEASREKLNRFFAFVVIPLLGVLLPNLSGLISNDRYPGWQLLLSYAYFVLTAYMIWKGNLMLYQSIRKKYETRVTGYFKMLFSYFLVNLLFSAAISVACLLLWQLFSQEVKFQWMPVIYTTSAVLICVTLINNVYEIVLLRKEMEETIIKFKRMEIAKMHAELEALKAQIDPHFIFNSLNTLSYLITNKPETAKYYNDTLARVYRYILSNKDNDLVFLKDELEFITNYFYLIKIRFEDGVNMIIEIPDVKAENYLITPISLQMLIENAIKHNYFSANAPLVIRINIQSNFVQVRNKIRKKEFQSSTSGIGLKNLKERYQLITKKDIHIYKENDEFIVKVPILKA
jgi:sensor histidine kinase YesM